jgi:putative DNA primase/helicase
MRASNFNGKHTPPFSDEVIEACIERLAKLPPEKYAEIREEAAQRLGLNISTLDSRVKNVRIINSGEGSCSLFPKIEPWPEPINPDELLSEIAATIRRFIVCEFETSLAATLWATMTWFMDEVKVAPLAVITAPEKRCGKTQLLSILSKISYRPLSSSNITPAVLFRAIDKWHPTLLIDEADSFLGANEELRGLLNAGHTRDSAYTLRCVGDDHEPTKFNLWGAKALAGIGKLPDTLMDRAIVLELRRKRPDEDVLRLRYASDGLFETMRRKLARFAVDYSSAIRAARPDLPDELNDRAQDNWEPLLAIADIASEDCGRLAREASVKLSSRDKDVPSLGVELLSDIFEIFEAKAIDRILTQELIKALCEDNEKRWATFNFRSQDRRITPKQLGQLLSEYHIASRNIRTGLVTVKKGYLRSQFEDAFQRYVPGYSRPSESPDPSDPETDATAATTTEIIPKASPGAGFHVAAGDTLKMLVADTGTA